LHARSLHATAAAAAVAAATAAATAHDALSAGISNYGGGSGGGREVDAAALRILGNVAVSMMRSSSKQNGVNNDEDEEDDGYDDDDANEPAPFAALARCIKSRIARDTDDLTLGDRMRFMSLGATLLGSARASAARVGAAVAEERAKAKGGSPGLKNEGGGGDDTTATATAITANPVLLAPLWDARASLELLDAWSFRTVLAWIDTHAAAHKYDALVVGATLLCQMVCATSACLRWGDVRAQGAGAQVADALFAERERAAVLPALLRLVHERGVADIPQKQRLLFILLEATHCALALAQRADAEGLVVDAGGGNGGKGALGSAAKAALALAVAEEDDEKANAAGDLDAVAAAAAQRARVIAVSAAKTEARMNSKKQRFHHEKYASDFVHPAIISAYFGVLQRYATNTPQVRIIIKIQI
jgi:hypothetical protein